MSEGSRFAPYHELWFRTLTYIAQIFCIVSQNLIPDLFRNIRKDKQQIYRQTKKKLALPEGKVEFSFSSAPYERVDGLAEDRTSDLLLSRRTRYRCAIWAFARLGIWTIYLENHIVYILCHLCPIPNNIIVCLILHYASEPKRPTGVRKMFFFLSNRGPLQ